MKITPIILAGGSGQRLLPFLKYNSPKQFVNVLHGRGNLLQNTLNRLGDHNIFKKPVIIGNLVHRDNLIKSVTELNYKIDSMMLEHEGRNTGPAIAAAALTLDDNALMLVLPIDHYISDEIAFLNKIIDCAKLIYGNHDNQNKIVSLFVTKTSIESNYGHLKLGKQLNCKLPVFAVDNFIEKPEVDDEDKRIVWNSGIYLMTAKTCKNMLFKNAPHILNHSHKAVTQGIERHIKGLRELILNHKYFGRNSKLSFDQILTMPYDPESLISTHIGTAWEDIGIWSGIKRLCEDSQYASVINKEIFKHS